MGELPAGKRLEFDFGLLAYQAAAEGLGIAVAQPEFVKEELRSGRLVSPFRNVVSTGNRYFIVCPASRRYAPAVARFLSWVGEHATTIGLSPSCIAVSRPICSACAA